MVITSVYLCEHSNRSYRMIMQKHTCNLSNKASYVGVLVHMVYWLLHLIVAAGPEESRVNEYPDKAAGGWRKASLWRWNHAATVWRPQRVACLCVIIAE